MNKPISIGELADWIIENRHGNAFKDDSWEIIVNGLTEDMNNNNLIYVLNPENQFEGLVTFVKDTENKILFVRNLLCTKYAALVILAQHFKQHFTGYNISANRYNEEVMYDTHRLIGHIIKGGY